MGIGHYSFIKILLTSQPSGKADSAFYGEIRPAHEKTQLNSGKMESRWNFKDNLLYEKNEQFLILPSEIKTILVLDNSLVILLDYNTDIGNRNVFCYNFNKVLKWQVPAPIEFHDKNDFTGIYLRGFELYVYNRNGVEYYLDKETGKVLDSELIK